ncbi:NAD(P)/FAD-dependent oxidoreductase [Rhizobium sp. C1]|uniref:NAD(P)/FAD-dependent oxidoreductase n=1 Tax=Rhizobium sp. C1 TaxID=1349799 RepID=UPI0022A92FFC|nr:NAD(P)/FAD-dependent oxidoreductase [Rhizobium sp. C1]
MIKVSDVIVIGAGAAGMMAAIAAGRRARRVTVLDHARMPGEKIRISGGGRCNFTNLDAGPKNYYSANPHFCKSALARYTPQDFLKLVEAHRIAWHEKTLGQVFCDGSAKEIVAMLLAEMGAAGAELKTGVEILGVEKLAEQYRVETPDGVFAAPALIVATGGKSIPKMGATGLAYKIAEQFGLSVTETRPALVPFTLEPGLLSDLSELAGLSCEAEIRCGKTVFREAMLFTHRGLSGPSVLQISAVWREGDAIRIRMEPDVDVLAALKSARAANGKQSLSTALASILPARLSKYIADKQGAPGHLADQSDKVLSRVAEAVVNWTIKPAGTEGYRTAEVTLGGIDTRELDSKTMEAKHAPGLYFIGECVDVTGWLGGYNFQWAWASGHAAGSAV